MKHTSISTALICLNLLCFNLSSNFIDAQSQEVSYENLSTLKNEYKANLAYILFGYVEVQYERILPSNSSAGIVFGKSIREMDLDYHLMAFYRLFFSKQSGMGFFIEGSGAFWKEDNFFFGETTNSAGVGVAIGGKFFRSGGFHGEFVLGLGRTLTDSFGDFEESYPRFAINLGQRF